MEGEENNCYFCGVKFRNVKNHHPHCHAKKRVDQERKVIKQTYKSIDETYCHINSRAVSEEIYLDYEDSIEKLDRIKKFFNQLKLDHAREIEEIKTKYEEKLKQQEKEYEYVLKKEKEFYERKMSSVSVSVSESNCVSESANSIGMEDLNKIERENSNKREIINHYTIINNNNCGNIYLTVDERINTAKTFLSSCKYFITEAVDTNEINSSNILSFLVWLKSLLKQKGEDESRFVDFLTNNQKYIGTEEREEEEINSAINNVEDEIVEKLSEKLNEHEREEFKKRVEDVGLFGLC